MKTKTFQNQKFPEVTIDIQFDNVYGGGSVKQYTNGRGSQSINFGQKVLNEFIDSLRKEGWN